MQRVTMLRGPHASVLSYWSGAKMQGVDEESTIFLELGELPGQNYTTVSAVSDQNYVFWNIDFISFLGSNA